MDIGVSWWCEFCIKFYDNGFLNFYCKRFFCESYQFLICKDRRFYVIFTDIPAKIRQTFEMKAS